MRGVPTVERSCSRCPSMRAGKDDLCNVCRLKSLTVVAPMYPFTAEQDAILRSAWASASNKRELSKAIGDATRRIGYPRHILRIRAGKLGLTNDTRRPWTRDELAKLRDLAGEYSVKVIARRLGRAWTSVQAQMDRLKISRELMRGYRKADFQRLVGVSPPTLDRWISAGLLPLNKEGRIEEDVVKKFLKRHPELYSLKRVDELWFKSVVFVSAPVFSAPFPDVKKPPVQASARGADEEAAC